MEKKGTFNRLLISVLVSAFLLTQTGCVRYYYLKEIDRKDPSTIKRYLQETENKFVHIGSRVIQVENLDYNSSSKTLTGLIKPTDEEKLQLYRNARKDGGNTRLESPEIAPDYYQTHYIVSDAKIISNVVSIELDDLLELQYLKAYSRGTSKLGIGGKIAAGGISTVAVGAIYLAIVCNCPHVYVQDGDAFIKNSNAFVGAISEKLETSDYSVLDHKGGTSIQVQIRNEEKQETQYFNQAELLQVTHAKNLEVLTDQQGMIYTVEEPILPIENIPSLHHKGDHDSYDFYKLSEKTDLSELELSFPRQGLASQGKLVLSTKNTSWASHVMQEWYSLFGSSVDEFKERNAKRTAASQLKWQQEQGITMSVYLKEKSRWKYQSTVHVVGNTVNRDLIVPIDLSNVEGPNVEIKLVAGFQLWELDYVAMDFSINKSLEINRIPLETYSVDGSEKTGSDLLRDDEYYEVLTYGSKIDLEFELPKLKEGESLTNVLHLKGYYEKELVQTGDLKKGEVLSFRKKAQMSRYSYYLLHSSLNHISAN